MSENKAAFSGYADESYATDGGTLLPGISGTAYPTGLLGDIPESRMTDEEQSISHNEANPG